MESKQATSWQNWSGSVRSRPQQIVQPGAIDELVDLVKSSAQQGRHIRVVGAGHSFTPLVQTDDILISLDALQGVEAVDTEQNIATVLGGSKLKVLGERLLAYGLAQENLGDIDVQSIAGAISTGTHGTGVRYGTLSTQVVGLTLVTAGGELLECSPEQHPEIFKAAQVSLGALGIIARVKLRVVPARRMHFSSHRASLSDCLTNLERYKQENSHFEFFWFPHTETAQAKFINETQSAANGNNFWGTVNDLVLENGAYWVLSECARLRPSLCRSISNISAQAISSVNKIDYSHRLYATTRLVRFQEMEYNIPAQHFTTVIAEIQNSIQRHRFAVHFPIECRFVHPDDIWLSPAYQRESAYVAVHMYKGMPYTDYFYHIEEIFKRYQGRPHWGKMHTQDAASLAQLYPHWQDFQNVRAELDPQGMFLNKYLRTLFATDQ